MNQYTFRYSGESRSDSFPQGTNLGQMKADARLQANLRFNGAKVKGHISGFPQEDSLVPPPGSVITFNDVATEKHVG